MMNYFDIVCILILGFCLIRGIFRGMIKEVAAIVGVIGGFYGAYAYYPNVGGYLTRWVSNEAYRHILSFMLIFCCILILVNVVALIVKYLLNVVFSGWLDRALGAGFGLVKALLIVCVLFIALTSFLPKGAPLIRDSVLSPHISAASEVLVSVVSNEMKQQFSRNVDELRKVWNKKQ
jgi:membrane protein required for colicin V production